MLAVNLGFSSSCSYSTTINGRSRSRRRRSFCCRAATTIDIQQTNSNNGIQNKRKVIVVGSGWAGLGAAHHLCKQGFDVTVIEDSYESGSKNEKFVNDDVGIRGFWYPYQNIFKLVDELGIKPFTSWTKSAQYSVDGLEVEFPIFQDLTALPTPIGTLFYTQFLRLPLIDRLTSLPLMAAVIDFDNTDSIWRKYDPITARELFKQFGCSERLYQDVIDPLHQVGLFAPAEQCSAAATLGMMYYFILSHQKNFDSVWCRGTIKENIFEPWMESMRKQGCKFLEGRRVTDVLYNDKTGLISEVVCGGENLEADVVIFAVGVSSMQEIIQKSVVLCTREEFLKVLNLASIDLLTVKLRLDKKVYIPNASNVCSGLDDSYGWTFFDLNAIHDEHKEDPLTIVQADFYHANELLPLNDDEIVRKVVSFLSKCITDFDNATVIDQEIGRFPKSLTHFYPGSYKYMMRGSTSFRNLFMAGDWIVNRHGSWSLEKSFVTGLEAANRVVDFVEEGEFAKIIAVEEDEPHVEVLRGLNRNFNEIRAQLPWSNYFLQ